MRRHVLGAYAIAELSLVERIVKTVVPQTAEKIRGYTDEPFPKTKVYLAFVYR